MDAPWNYLRKFIDERIKLFRLWRLFRAYNYRARCNSKSFTTLCRFIEELEDILND